MGEHELNSISSDQLHLKENIILRSSTYSDAATNVRTNRQSKKVFISAGFVVVLGIGCLAVGVLLIVLSQNWGQKSTTEEKNHTSETQSLRCNTTDKNSSSIFIDRRPGNLCDLSLEAERVGLRTFLNRVSNIRKSLTPYKSLTRDTFQPYNPYPGRIKAFTGKTRDLYEELQHMKAAMDISRLKLRERRLMARLEHDLKHFFGKPYKNNYYTGAWMLGPSQRCRAEPITSLKSHLNVAIYVHLTKGNQPLSDADNFLRILSKFEEGIDTYKSNLQRGVKSGMVRSTSECLQGIDCMRQWYPFLSSSKSAKNIFRWYTSNRLQNFVSRLSPEELSQWTAKHGKNISRSLLDGVIKFVGKPLVRLFEYLENNYTLHCVPDNVSSGMFARPVDHVYVNGTRTAEETNPTLADGQNIINGKQAYASVLSYFTTTNLTADEVFDLGWKLLTKYYRQAIEIAKVITGRKNETKAVSEFKRILNSMEIYLNKQQFPTNESNKEAYQNCRTMKTSSVRCPQRYSTMQRWIDVARSTVAQLQPILVKLFHITGKKRTVPSCPIELAVDFFPPNAVASYQSSTSSCLFPARYRLPFFVEKMGSEAMEWTTGAHEAIPGHHLQKQSYKEIFHKEACSDEFKFSSVTAYKEGWASYAENPLIGHDSDLYEGQPLRRYGMIKAQIWRALRLIIDTGLHYKNMSRDQAVSIFRQYMWDDSDLIEKEVARYQAWPGQATAYMIGQLEIWRMRNESEASLGGKFDLRDFHFHVLSQGEVPLWFLDDYIKHVYVNCVLQGVSDSDKRCSEASVIRELQSIEGQKFSPSGVN